jgi:hypothetical protein
MTETVNDKDRLASAAAIAFPVVGWEGIIGEQPFCLVRFGYVRTQEESEAVRAGAAAPFIPLGLTADQCRRLAYDLVQAADVIDSRKHPN